MKTALKHKQSNTLAIVISVMVFILYLGINLFSNHESNFPEMANTIILAVILIIAAVLSFRLHNKSPDKKEASQVWLMFGISLAIYALAQMSRLAYLLAGRNPPYPGPSDLIYFTAYIFLIIGFINKIHLFNTNSTRRRWIAFALICGILLILIYTFVMYPVALSVTANNPLGILVHAYYPLADFFIFMLALFLLLALWGRKISSAWILICAGALFLALTDIVYIYADWNGLYYPGDQINVISEIIDMGAVVFALLIVWGFFIQTKLKTVRQGELSPNGGLDRKR